VKGLRAFIRVAYLSFLYVIYLTLGGMLFALLRTVMSEFGNFIEFIHIFLTMSIVIVIPFCLFGLVLDFFRIRAYCVLVRRLKMKYSYFLSLDTKEQEALARSL